MAVPISLLTRNEARRIAANTAKLPHAVIDFDQITGAAGWARVVCWRGIWSRPRVELRFRCNYGVQRRCGVGAWLVQHHSGCKWASSTPSCKRSDSHGGDPTALAG